MKKRNLLIIGLIVLLVNVNVFAETVTCEKIMTTEFIGEINKKILVPLKFIAPILLLVLTTVDFAKVVFSDNKDGMAKAWKNFTRRASGTILVFFASNIVGIIYGLISGVGPCFRSIYGNLF